MPTVFVSNASPDHNYDAAEEYGCVTYVTSGNYPIFKTSRLAEEIAKALAHSHRDDYLAPSGSSVIAGLCMSAWLLLHGHVNLLLYDKRERRYEERLIGRENMLKTLEYERDRLFDKEHKNG